MQFSVLRRGGRVRREKRRKVNFPRHQMPINRSPSFESFCNFNRIRNIFFPFFLYSRLESAKKTAFRENGGEEKRHCYCFSLCAPWLSCWTRIYFLSLAVLKRWISFISREGLKGLSFGNGTHVDLFFIHSLRITCFPENEKSDDASSSSWFGRNPNENCVIILILH